MEERERAMRVGRLHARKNLTWEGETYRTTTASRRRSEKEKNNHQPPLIQFDPWTCLKVTLSSSPLSLIFRPRRSSASTPLVPPPPPDRKKQINKWINNLTALWKSFHLCNSPLTLSYSLWWGQSEKQKRPRVRSERRKLNGWKKNKKSATPAESQGKTNDTHLPDRIFAPPLFFPRNWNQRERGGEFYFWRVSTRLRRDKFSHLSVLAVHHDCFVRR